MKVFFDVEEYYYLPQYEPVIYELAKRNIQAYLLVHESKSKYFANIDISELGVNEILYYSFSEEKQELINQYKPAWVVFGNYTKRIEPLPKETKFALIQHGVGPKNCYYKVSDGDFDIRFVEGAERLQKLQGMYPHKNFLDVGFVKLDPIINSRLTVPELSELGLDKNKKTILYAPSFFPCSIESLPLNLPEKLNDYNIILKPHFFSLSRDKFKKHKQRLEHWARKDNVYLVPVESTNILPYYVLADVMFSDASSTVFEFIALDKPVIWFQKYKISWAYKGLLSYRLKKRMDFDLQDYFSIGAVANDFHELCNAIKNEIETPNRFQLNRQKYTEQLIGKVDGQVKQRVVDYLVAN